MAPLSLQDPSLVYAGLAATGSDLGLRWVQPALVAEAPPCSLAPPSEASADPSPGPRLLATPLASTLPPSLVEQAQAALEAGRPSAWEGLSLLLAPAEWAVASRALLWTAWGPRPALLDHLLQSAGVPRALHGGDPEAMARLVGQLALWRPHRGLLHAVARVLQAAGRPELLAPIAASGAAPPAEELFSCHGVGWWAVELGGQPQAPTLRVAGGWLRIGWAAPPAPRPPAQLALELRSPTPLDPVLCRLLPVWASARLQDRPESTP